MQESVEPQVKSKKLRELLTSKSHSRSITPSRSELMQSISQESQSKNDLANPDEKPKDNQEVNFNLKTSANGYDHDKKIDLPPDFGRRQDKKENSSSKSIKNLSERIGSPISHHENHFLEDNQSKINLDSFLQNELLITPRSQSEKLNNEIKKIISSSEESRDKRDIEPNKENPVPITKPSNPSSRNIFALKEQPELELMDQGSFQMPASKRTPKNIAANEATTPRLRGYSPRNTVNFMDKGFNDLPLITEGCKVHQNNSIVYICLKDKCGDLLCPLCLYDHQRNKHIGEYEDLATFSEKIKIKLGDAKSKLLESIDRAAVVQTTLQKKENFDLKICEDLDRIEEALIKNLRSYFDTLRQEYKAEFFFEYKKSNEEVQHLHERINVTIRNIEAELQNFNDQNAHLHCHYMSDLVRKNYIDNSLDMQKKLHTLDQKISSYLKSKKIESSPKSFSLEVDANLKSKLMLLLNEGVKVSKMKIQSPNLHKKRDTNEDILNYYKELQKSKEIVELNRSRHLDIIEEVESPSEKFRARTHSPRRDILSGSTGSRILAPTKKDNIQNPLLDLYKMTTPQPSLDEKDLDVYAMKYLIEYTSNYYNTNKIKIFDQEFFQKLLSVNGPVDFASLDLSSLRIENVSDLLNVTSMKHKTIFTSHERIFFLLQDRSLNWILTEIRTNPKMVIVYDFLGKLSRNKATENIFGILFEIIRSEYRGKLNQNPDHYSWEKKVSNTPSLVVKNAHDTGLLLIKIISNAYQTKDFTNTRVSLNEINMIRKKIEKIFDSKNQGKFITV